MGPALAAAAAQAARWRDCTAREPAIEASSGPQRQEPGAREPERAPPGSADAGEQWQRGRKALPGPKSRAAAVPRPPPALPPAAAAALRAALARRGRSLPLLLPFNSALPQRLKAVDFYRKLPTDLTEATLSGAVISIATAVFILFLLGAVRCCAGWGWVLLAGAWGRQRGGVAAGNAAAGAAGCWGRCCRGRCRSLAPVVVARPRPSSSSIPPTNRS